MASRMLFFAELFLFWATMALLPPSHATGTTDPFRTEDQWGQLADAPGTQRLSEVIDRCDAAAARKGGGGEVDKLTAAGITAVTIHVEESTRLRGVAVKLLRSAAAENAAAAAKMDALDEACAASSPASDRRRFLRDEHFRQRGEIPAEVPPAGTAPPVEMRDTVGDDQWKATGSTAVRRSLREHPQQRGLSSFELPAAEIAALVAIRVATGGDRWKNKWPVTPGCSSYGVACSNNGHVIKMPVIARARAYARTSLPFVRVLAETYTHNHP